MSAIVTSSRRPYLLRAMHEWISDNGMTPYIVVDANEQGVEVPREYVQDGKIILNVSYTAANTLELGNEWVMFDARFSGKAFNVAIPCQAVLAIYAKETGQGLIFDEEEDFEPDPGQLNSVKENKEVQDSDDHDPNKPKKGKPSLRIVK